MKTLSEALTEIRKQYPTMNSGDIQSFILGWNAKEANLVKKYCICGAEYDGIKCDNCGFDASEVDIY